MLTHSLKHTMAHTLALEAGDVMLPLLVVGLLAVSVVMILVVLIQKPQGGGLSGAFGAGGGGGAGQTAFGTKTGDMLTLFTIVCFVAFLGLAIGLNFGLRPGPEGAGPAAAAGGGVPAEGDSEDGAAGLIEPPSGGPAEAPTTEPPTTEAPPTEEPATEGPSEGQPASEEQPGDNSSGSSNGDQSGDRGGDGGGSL